VHVQVSVNLVRDSNGTPMATVATVADITSLKRVEQELRLKTQPWRRRSAPSSSAGWTGGYSTSTMPMSVCPATPARNWSGNRSWSSSRGAAHRRRRDAHGLFVGQVDHRGKDGTVSHVQLAVNLIRDANGMPVASVSTMSDISPLKRAEQELKLKDAAIAIAANGIAMVDLDGKFTYVNDAFSGFVATTERSWSAAR